MLSSLVFYKSSISNLFILLVIKFKYEVFLSYFGVRLTPESYFFFVFDELHVVDDNISIMIFFTLSNSLPNTCLLASLLDDTHMCFERGITILDSYSTAF